MPSIILSEASPSDDGHGRDERAPRRRMHKPQPRKMVPSESALAFSPFRRLPATDPWKTGADKMAGLEEGSDTLLAPRVVHLSPRRRLDADASSPRSPLFPFVPAAISAFQACASGDSDNDSDRKLLRVFGSGRNSGTPQWSTNASPATPRGPQSPLRSPPSASPLGSPNRRDGGALRITASTAFSVPSPSRSKPSP